MGGVLTGHTNTQIFPAVAVLTTYHPTRSLRLPADSPTPLRVAVSCTCLNSDPWIHITAVPEQHI